MVDDDDDEDVPTTMLYGDLCRRKMMTGPGRSERPDPVVRHDRVLRSVLVNDRIFAIQHDQIRSV